MPSDVVTPSYVDNVIDRGMLAKDWRSLLIARRPRVLPVHLLLRQRLMNTSYHGLLSVIVVTMGATQRVL